MKILKMMSTPVVSVPVEATIEAAIKIMSASNVRHLPVVEKNGHLVGLISDRDLRDVTVKLGRSDSSWVPSSAMVADYMVKNPTVVTPEEEVQRAARMMEDGSFGCLPVVEAGKLRGILTTTDLLRALVKLLDLVESRQQK